MNQLQALQKLEENKEFTKDIDLVHFFLTTPYLCGLKQNDYSIKKDEKYHFKVDIFSNFSIKNKNLHWIPIKLDDVAGYFDCSKNQLTSLEFGPYSVGSYYDCSENLLSSLMHSPKKIPGLFLCYKNKIKNFKDGPDWIGEDLRAENNKVESLLYFPHVEKKVFLDYKNLLKYKPADMNKQDFMEQNMSSFWTPIHLKEKALFEQTIILNSLPEDHTAKKSRKI